MKKHIPNIFTCLNLLCGLLAIVSIFRQELAPVIWLLSFALVFDFLDGFVARLLKVSSPMGKELDSLADMVTFGVVPGFIMAYLIQLSMNGGSLNTTSDLFSSASTPSWFWVGFLVTVFSALRLAKFNIDDRQSDSFYGVPTPANTLLVLSFWVIVERFPEHLLTAPLGNQWVLVALCLLCAWLLVLDLRLIAFKFKSYGLKENMFRYILLAFSVIGFAIWNFGAIPFIILLYICLSIIENYQIKKASTV